MPANDILNGPMEQETKFLQGIYTDALQDQLKGANAFRVAISSYSDAIHGVVLSLGHLHNVMLQLYEEGWPNRDVLAVCLGDEQATWKNYERDLTNTLESFLHHYETSCAKMQNSVSNSLQLETDYNHSRQELRKMADGALICRNDLTVKCPKIIASRVRFVSECFCTVFDLSAKLQKEMNEIHQVALALCRELPHTHPQVVIGNSSQRVILSIHNAGKKEL